MFVLAVVQIGLETVSVRLELCLPLTMEQVMAFDMGVVFAMCAT